MECRAGFLYFLIFITIQVIHGDYSQEESLYKYLTQKYGEKVQPRNCTVYMKVAMLCLTLYETSRSMNTRMSEVYGWKDDRLTWAPEDYGGLDQITIPNHLVWLPKITIVNTVMAPEREGSMDVVVRPNGWVTWLNPCNYKMSYVVNNGSTELPYLGRLRYVTATRTVENIKLEFLDYGLENKYIAECQPYYVAMFRTRKTTFNTVNGRHPQLEIEYIIRKNETTAW
jgi:hypothetical protein